MDLAGVIVSWEQFSLRLRDALEYLPYTEDQPAMELDMALCAFGESVCPREGLRNAIMVGWWSVVTPTTGQRSSSTCRWSWRGSFLSTWLSMGR